MFHSFHLDDFDPLLLFSSLYPHGPGFLESAGTATGTGRYSIVPLRRRESYRLNDDGLFRILNGQENILPGDPFRTLAAILASRHLPEARSTSPFSGGFFGYFSYDLAGWIEDLPRAARRDLPVPHLWLDWSSPVKWI